MVRGLKSGGNKKCLIIFLVAAVIRGLLFFSVLEHPQMIFQPDSRMYAGLAEGIRQHGSFSGPDTSWEPNVERMIGYPVFLAFLLSMFGGSYLAVVAFQAVLDSVSCVLVGVLGERVWSGTGLLAGIFAAVNLNMLTYSLFVLSDSLFLLILLVGILAMIRFLEKPVWRAGAFLGVFLGLATLVRPVLFYFSIFLMPFLWAFFVWKKRVSIARSAGLVLVSGLLFAVVVVPWFIRNQAVGGRFQLTSQAGEHLLQYVVPFVWQYSKGTPFIEGMKKANREMALKNEQEAVDWKRLSAFERSERQVDMAIEILKKEPLLAIIKAWGFGMAKNLFAPAIIDLSYLLNVERPHFFYTQGKTLVDRGINFVKGIEGWFGWAVLGSLVLMPIVRLAQLWGLICLFRKEAWIAGLFTLIIGYFLLVSGPVGYAKYRLPFEPVLIVLLGVGIKEIASRFPVMRLRRSPSAKVEGSRIRQ